MIYITLVIIDACNDKFKVGDLYLGGLLLDLVSLGIFAVWLNG